MDNATLQLINVGGLIFTVIGVITSIWAIRLSLRQIRMSNQQTEQANGLIQTTTSISKSLSTRFVGEFPRYLPEVTSLIAEAKYSIRIMALVPSHGEYTDPDGWYAISQAIVSKIRQNSKNQQFEAVLVYCSKTCALAAFKLHHRELEKDEEWITWREEEKTTDRLPRFLRAHTDIASDVDTNLSNLSWERYLQIRIDADRKALGQVYKGFTLKESGEPLPMFCWIVDSKTESQKAVFSLRTEDAKGHYRGAGVVTADPGLIATLTTMVEYYNNLPSTTDKTPTRHF